MSIHTCVPNHMYVYNETREVTLPDLPYYWITTTPMGCGSRTENL